MNNIEYKKKLFCDRIDNFIELPVEMKNSLSESFLDTSTYLLPSLDTNNKEKQILIDEIGLILDELEFFEREKRKRKLVTIMEKIADCLDDDAFTEEELTDRLFYGNRTCVIEKEYIRKRGAQGINYFNNQMCAKLNNILEDDDKITFIKRKMYRKILGGKGKCMDCNKRTKNELYKCNQCKSSFHINCSRLINGIRYCYKCKN